MACPVTARVLLIVAASAFCHGFRTQPERFRTNRTPENVAQGAADSHNMEAIGKGIATSEEQDPFGGMVVVGHRGSSVDFPENTVQAAVAAFDKGAIGTEFDVHVSADNQVFVLHDNTLDRTASEPTENFTLPDQEMRTAGVDSLSYNEHLRHVDVGSYLDLPKGKPERVPLLQDMMRVVTERSTVESPKFAFCELKRGEVENMAIQMTRIVRRERYQKENLIFISFDIRILWLMQQALPEFRSLFIACGPSSRVRFPACSTPYAAHEALAIALYPKEASEAYDAGEKFYKSHYPESNREKEMEFASRAAATKALEMRKTRVLPESRLAGIDLMAATDYATKDVVSEAHQHGMQVAVWVWPDTIPEHVKGSDGGDTLGTAKTLASFGVDFFTSNLPDDIVTAIS